VDIVQQLMVQIAFGVRRQPPGLLSRLVRVVGHAA